MAENRKSGKDFLSGVLQSIGGSVVLSVSSAVWDKVKHGSVDWLGIAALFLLGCAAFGVLILLRRAEERKGRMPLPPQTDAEAIEKRVTAQCDEAHKEEIRKLKAQQESELWRAKECYRQCEEERKEDLKRLAMFSPLQLDVLRLAKEVRDVLAEIGPFPPPKYSAEEIRAMPLRRSRELIESNDPDYAESCEFHFGNEDTEASMRENFAAASMASRTLRLLAWCDRLTATYNLKLSNQIETMKHRLVLAGVRADQLKPPPGLSSKADGSMRELASALWDAARDLGEKEALGEKS